MDSAQNRLSNADAANLKYRLCFKEQEQQRVAVGPGKAQCMSIRQVSLRRGTCGQSGNALWPAAAGSTAALLCYKAI